MKAYGMKIKNDPIKFLLDLNLELSKKEDEGAEIVGPGLPPCVMAPGELVSADCVAIDY